MKMLVLGTLVNWMLSIYCHNELAIVGDGIVYFGKSRFGYLESRRYFWNGCLAALAQG